MDKKAPIGVFDSGYGGLTVFKSIVAHLPQYDYIYLGDNARAPYGNRSFETVHEYTWECVQWFFKMGCPLVILACNTASAKALRTIQQQDLPVQYPEKRVLGVIRPTAEVVGDFTKTKSVGVLGTKGTVASGSYLIEIHNFFPDVKVYQVACPSWVQLIEDNEHNSPGADYFVKKYIDELMSMSGDIDTILLACTHYPLLMDKIKKFLPQGRHIEVVAQGEIVSTGLEDYLKRHPEIDEKLTKNASIEFYTTDNPSGFDEQATVFFGKKVASKQVHL
jgi:glutamate racemase